MTQPNLIAASILSADFSNLAGEINQAESAGADWIHIDVMDGHFVPNLTMGAFIVATCRRITTLPLDVHLMVDAPGLLLESFAQAGASSLTVHVEAVDNLEDTIRTIRNIGCKAGLALNPDTPASSVKAVLHLVDLALVMTVYPGYSGQAFIPETLPKVAAIREMLDDLNSEADLQVDGGIDPKTLPQTRQAGANVFVAASAIFKHPQGISAGIRSLKNALSD